MSVFWEAVLAIFAAIGLYTFLHVVYELCFARLLRMHGSAELTLYGDGNDAFGLHCVCASNICPVCPSRLSRLAAAERIILQSIWHPDRMLCIWNDRKRNG